MILGNDQILCGNVASTYYVVTPMKDSTHPLCKGRVYSRAVKDDILRQKVVR